MFKLNRIKNVVAVLTATVAMTGCVYFDALESIAGELGFTLSKEVPPLDIPILRTYGPLMSCKEVGGAVANAHQLNKKGMSKEDIFWEITPMEATYIQQHIYIMLIDLGIKSTEKDSKKYTQICYSDIAGHQKAFDGLSVALFNHVDLIYTTVYYTEKERYDSYKGLVAGWKYGGSESSMYKRFVTKSPGYGIDPIGHEINNMIAEQVLPMLYGSKYYSHKDLPSIEEIRRKLAPDLVITLY